MTTADERLSGYEDAVPGRHPKVTEPFTLVLIVVLSIFGAIVGLQLITTLGITANTSIIGALVAMAIARVPLAYFRSYRSVHRQNLQQTAISGATFGAANALLLPIGIPWALGRPDLVWPMLVGATAGLLIDSYVLYRVFDSRIFPASGTWPPGVAAGETIIAGDKGGRRAQILAGGAAVGLLGSIFVVPGAMSAFGVAFIGNIFALTMFGVGLLVNGYFEPLFGLSLADYYVPSGVMIGAGLVALIQVVEIIRHRRGDEGEEEDEETAAGATSEVEAGPGITTDERSLTRGLEIGFGLYLVAGVVLAVVGGIFADMSPLQLVLWVVYAAIAAMVSELIVGLSAMHAGWFPAFGTALAFLGVGIIIGFPAVPLALLAGYTASTGPAFADMGYDFKAGWLLRRQANSVDYEREGRLQQYFADLIGFAVGLVIVALVWRNYFSQDLIPPVDVVFADTIKAGTAAGLSAVGLLLLWAVPGALLQWLGGPSRQMGILFATGLLITFPAAGWAVLAGILIRFVILRYYGERAETPMTIAAAGIIAGDAIYGFSSVFRTGG
jgi:uncharacterized oligopeptide transporter (OPT) family protein